MKVAFIGLGSMGSGMAQNLIKAAHEVTVFNRTRAKAEPFQKLGAKIAESPRQAAEGAEAVITMMSDDRALESVVSGDQGFLSTLAADAIHISMSTISVALSRKLEEVHRTHHQHYVAAPVFGRPEAAAAAKLFVVVAGEPRAIERVRPLLDAMGQKTFEVGDQPSAANLFKISGNFLITTVIEGLAESFALIRKSGYDAQKFLDVLTNSLFNAPIYQNYGRIVLNQQFDPPGFQLPLGLKDNRLVLAAAQEQSVPMPLANLVGDRFLSAIAQGMSDKDWSAIAKVTYESAGLE